MDTLLAAALQQRAYGTTAAVLYWQQSTVPYFTSSKLLRYNTAATALARICLDKSDTNYTRTIELQWRLVTTTWSKLKWRDLPGWKSFQFCRELTVAGLHPGRFDRENTFIE
jgi:hypothetical protein